MFKYPVEYLETASSYLKLNKIDFSGAKILLTGASGFVGSWLIELLRFYSERETQNFTLIGLSRNLYSTHQKIGQDNFKFLSWIEGDVEKIPEIELKFTHAIHCATPTTRETGSSDTENVRRASITGMQYLLSAAKINGNCPRILHTSSGAVYGNANLVDGRFLLNQGNFEVKLDKNARHYVYAKAKRETERILNQATQAGDVSGINARLFAFFGPGLSTTSHYAIGNLVNQALFSESLNLDGTGLATRSYSPGNVMAAKILFLLNTEFIGATHIGSSNGETLGNWARMISEISGKPVKILNKTDDSSDKYVPSWDERIPKINFQQDVTKIIHQWLNYVSSNSKLS